jgi:hypothetical protein
VRTVETGGARGIEYTADGVYSGDAGAAGAVCGSVV